MIRDKERGALPIGALVLILIGVFWLAQEYGWVPSSIEIWPIALIVIGIALLVNNYWKIY